MPSAFRFSPSSFRHRPLVVALATILCVGSVDGSASAQSRDGDASWIRFRTDASRRLFPQLPAARRAGTAPQAVAATLPVTSCADDGPGTLRAVVATAGDSDVVDLSALTCGTISLETGAIAVQLDDLTLIGPGRSGLAIDGNDLDRVLLHYGGGTLVLQGLTITGGRNRATGFDVAGGGCIASAGYLVLDSTTVKNCYAGGEGAYGGALYAYSLTMLNSTLSDNHGLGIHEDAGTAAFGGGAFVYAMQIIDSTVSGNRADHRVREGRSSYDIGGGIIAVRGGQIINSTIDSNYSQGRGGGIAAFTSVSAANSTISGNVARTELGGGMFLRWPSTLALSSSTVAFNQSATAGGGIWINVDSTFQSSIVYGNAGGDVSNLANPQGNPFAITIAGDNNLIGSTSGSIAIATEPLHADPLLAPLAYNGGITRTHALGLGSPAVDTGNNVGALAFDQRGAEFPRVFGAAPDIGAFEQQGLLPPAIAQVAVPTLSRAFEVLLAGVMGWMAVGALRRRTSGRD